MNPRGSCRVCDHPERARINELLRTKGGATAVKRVYHLAAGTVYRHIEHTRYHVAAGTISRPSKGKSSRVEGITDTRALVARARPSEMVFQPPAVAEPMSLFEPDDIVEDLEYAVQLYLSVERLATDLLGTDDVLRTFDHGPDAHEALYHDAATLAGVVDVPQKRTVHGEERTVWVTPVYIGGPEGPDLSLEELGPWCRQAFDVTFSPHAPSGTAALLREVQEAARTTARTNALRLAALLAEGRKTPCVVTASLP